MSYNPRMNLYTLQLEPISKAAAKQRAGRAGRTRNGYCWRLYAKHHFDTVMPDNTLPEMLRDDMADAVLKLVSTLGREGIMTFPFISQPAPEVMLRTWWALKAIGCFDSTGEITNMGLQASKMHISPRYAMAFLRAVRANPSPAWEVAAIVALLEEDELFLRGGPCNGFADVVRDKTSIAAGMSHRVLRVCRCHTIPTVSIILLTKTNILVGDHFTLLNVWHAFSFELHKLAKSKVMTGAQRDRHIKQWCLENYLDETALQSAKKTFDRITESVTRPSLPAVQVLGYPLHYTMIKKCLLQAFFTEIAVHETKVGGENDYRLLVGNQSALVHPASVIASGHKPDFVFFDKLLDQGKSYFWTCTGFESRWLFEDELIADYINKLLDKSTLVEGQGWGRSLFKLDMAREKYRKSLPSSA